MGEETKYRIQGYSAVSGKWMNVAHAIGFKAATALWSLAQPDREYPNLRWQLRSLFWVTVDTKSLT